ncbi:endogenous retrovirus group K3 member 1 [Moschus berezovskii]|uniref:endogenous retrovirus group K3 member 1 n=1 Tax=Moschus berezovskii TaxID=68408 RepID=UPI00244409D9|nr:endogenous retrovirus group K3 member 1 [Moschus berezovskii]
MVFSLQMEKKFGLCSGIYVSNPTDPSGAPKWVMHITKQMASVLLEEDRQRRAKRHRASPVPPYPTWAQIKNLTWKAEDVLKETGTPKTPDKPFLSMLAILSCASMVSDVSGPSSPTPTQQEQKQLRQS